MVKVMKGSQSAREWGKAFAIVALFAGLSVVAPSAMAGGGGSDPLGDGMCNVVKLFTGKWAFGLVVAGLIGIGSAIIFGSEMNELLKKVITWVAAAALVIGGSGLVSKLIPSISATCT